MTDLLTRTPPRADRRLPYGSEPSQFADLWLPKAGVARHAAPVAVFLHGGWWGPDYDLTHASFFCAALRDAGAAVYNLEYQRLGVTGGGWPATFLDAAAGFGSLETVAKTVRLDLARVIAVGHSAGALLAFWLAGRQHVIAGSAIAAPLPQTMLTGVLSLAGVVDLGLTLDLAQGMFAANRRRVELLMGGSQEQVPDRYLAADPGHLLPLGVPQRLVQGTVDDQIPPGLPQRWAEKARRRGDRVDVAMLSGVGHMELIDPESRACEVSLRAARQMLGI